MFYEYTIRIEGVQYLIREQVDYQITEHKTPFFRWVYYQLANLWR